MKKYKCKRAISENCHEDLCIHNVNHSEEECIKHKSLIGVNCEIWGDSYCIPQQADAVEPHKADQPTDA